LRKSWPALDIYVGHPNASAVLGAPAPGRDPQLQELVLAELDDFQPTAIQEPEREQTPKVRAFFASADARAAATRALGAAFGAHLFVESVDVDDEDWAARSQAELRAVTIGRLIVAPPWDVPGPERAEGRGKAESRGQKAEGNVVVIQPSMGFGTGHHATTRLTLLALQSLDLKGRTVLDIGCGSGVLAIGAVTLGARLALGIDIDPDALGNANENAMLNALTPSVRFEQQDFRDLSTPAHIVVSNLTGELLEKSAGKLAELVSPGGYLIVSGFMEGEDAVLPALEQFLELKQISQEDEWRCAVLARRSAAGAAKSIPGADI
jgi:ribosomal protein L11 methyltransferase